MIRSIVTLAVALAGANAVPAAAQELTVPPDMLEAIAEWSSCRTEHILPRIETDIPADVLVDAALDLCEQAQARAAETYRKYWGDEEGAAVVLEHRAGFRENLIQMVENRRTGQPLQSPYAILGDCLGNGLPGGIPPAKFNAAYAAAWEDCSPHVERLRQTLAREHGEELADEMMAMIPNALRDALKTKIYGN